MSKHAIVRLRKIKQIQLDQHLVLDLESMERFGEMCKATREANQVEGAQENCARMWLGVNEEGQPEAVFTVTHIGESSWEGTCDLLELGGGAENLTDPCPPIC